MLRLVLSKTGQRAEGGWRQGQESRFALARGGLELQRPEGNRSAVFLQMRLNPMRATTRDSQGCSVTVSDTWPEKGKGWRKVTVGKSTPTHDSGVSPGPF